MILTLFIANILIPLWLAWKSCVRPQGLEFSHVLMFTLGYIAYWVLPIGLGLSHVASDEPALALWYSLYDSIAPLTLTLYLCITLAGYLSFWWGSEWVRRKLPEPQRRGAHYRPLFFYRSTLQVPLLIGAVLAALYAFLLRGQLFTGYSIFQSPTPTPERSSFTAVSVFLLSVALLYTVKRDEENGWTGRFRRLIANRSFAVYAVAAILVLSLGGRLYFLSSLVMLLVYRTVYFRRLPIKRVVLFTLTVGVLVGLAGQVRQGRSVSLTSGLINVVSEPIYCSLPVMRFLQVGHYELIKFPLFLIGNFVNLIPSAVFPAKLSLMVSPQDYGYDVFEPLGGECSFFPFMINFGVLGTLAVLFLVGAGMSALRGRDRNLLYRVLYVMLTGWMGFSFFRDPFFVSVVKNMVEFSIAVPILMVIMLQLASVSLRHLNRRAGPTLPAPPEGQAQANP